MSGINIYEDQENRVPVPLHERGLTHKHGESGARLGQQNFTSLQNQKSNVLQNKRTVLSSINLNSSNVRVQPRRAAKQGVSYSHESGVTHASNENASTKPCKSFALSSSTSTNNTTSSSTSSLPSFTIHEDSSSSTSSSNSSWPVSLKSSTAASAASSSALTTKTSTSTASLKLRDITDLTQSPIKNKTKGKLKTNEVKSSKYGRVDTPEAMDISITDIGAMSVDTPLVVATLPREDILEKKENDFWDVPEYAEDIYTYLRNAEMCHKPWSNYMLKQTDITSSMRWILVDWLVEVSEEYSLQTETLYLAVSYIDRFLSQMSVKRDKLQLVGTTAMFIASKYEEIYPPDVSQFAYITDNTYRVSQILRMEHLILKVLSFDMAVPTALVFLNYFAKICGCDEETKHLAMFVAELSMLDSDPFLRFLPSTIAASAVALANFTQGKEAWPKVVEDRSKLSLSDLRECYLNLHRSFCRVHTTSQHAIRDKYKAAEWHGASLLSPRKDFPF